MQQAGSIGLDMSSAVSQVRRPNIALIVQMLTFLEHGLYVHNTAGWQMSASSPRTAHVATKHVQFSYRYTRYSTSCIPNASTKFSKAETSRRSPPTIKPTTSCSWHFTYLENNISVRVTVSIRVPHRAVPGPQKQIPAVRQLRRPSRHCVWTVFSYRTTDGCYNCGAPSHI